MGTLQKLFVIIFQGMILHKQTYKPYGIACVYSFFYKCILFKEHSTHILQN